jgi:hypothetical protein
VLQLHERNQQLQISIQRLANIKEFRTPQVCAVWLGGLLILVGSHPPPKWRPIMQGVRSLSRFYLILFIPVFFGPYWSWVSHQTNFAFAFFFCCLVCAMFPYSLHWETCSNVQAACTGKPAPTSKLCLGCACAAANGGDWRCQCDDCTGGYVMPLRCSVVALPPSYP